MSNEVTALAQQVSQQQQILCFAEKEVFSADNFGNYSHLWEISKPFVVAPPYFTQNPTGPVPPQQSNQATSPQFNETARMQAFGDYTGSTATTYLIKSVAPNLFKWSKDNGATWSSNTVVTAASQLLELGIQVKFFSTAGFTGNESWTFYVFQPQFNTLGYSRWQLWAQLGNLFFVNPFNTLRYLNGRTINTFAWSTDYVPAGRHIYMFYEHLVITDPVINGQSNPLMVAWSGLRDYMKWETQLFINEADNYQLDDILNSPEVWRGCTGLMELNPVRIGFGPPRLCIYTPKSIYMMEYVGEKLIMQKSHVHDECGCAFPYGLVANKDIHLFIAADNFYMMQKDAEPKPIGDRVFSAFMSLLSENPIYRYKLYGYHDQVRREVWWVFVSKDSPDGDFDTKVGYNYVSDTWQFADANEHSFLHCRLPSSQGLSIAQLTGTIADLSGPIGTLGQSGNTVLKDYRLYGQIDRQVSYEVTDTVTAIDQAMDEPYLITGDIIYDPGKVVTVDGMYIHADYDPASCAGIEVAVSGRMNIANPIVWEIAPKLWTREELENLFSWPRKSAKIFNFRFTFKKAPGSLAVRRAHWFFWNEVVKGLQEVSAK